MEMPFWHAATFCLAIVATLATGGEVYYQPRHVHLSLGPEPNSLILTWSTINKTGPPLVLMGETIMMTKYDGSSKLFIDDGELHAQQWIHKAVIRGLKPNTKYVYSVGSDLGWSPLYETRTLESGSDWSPVIALFGDLGNENAVSLPHLQKGALEKDFDLILHVGDFAYDMYEDNGRRGDVFMEQIEPIATRVPYMTCPGNHEHHYNFSNYKARFNMPGDEDNRMFYTFTVGPVRFFSVSTEYYYYYLQDAGFVQQHIWLEEELAKANTASAREDHPWIVLFGHRPMYCSNTDHDDCTSYETKTRIGFPPLYNTGLEEMMYRHGVDLAIWAHEHSYERLLPIYNKQIMSGPDPEDPYWNPLGPVHVVSGSAGCREKHDDFIKDPPPWSAFRSSDYGYTILEVANKTHLHLKQLSVEKNLSVVDEFWLVKEYHGSFLPEIYILEFFYSVNVMGSKMMLMTLKVGILVLLIIFITNFRTLMFNRRVNFVVYHY